MNDERMRRWRLVLGGEGGADGTGHGADRRRPADRRRAGRALPGRRAETAAVAGRSAGLGASAPNVARWLGDIRTYFPSSVVQVMQADAIERLNLTRLLLEPEMLEAVEPDVHLVGTLLSLNGVMPEKTKQTARMVVGKVVAELERRVAQQHEGGGHRRAQPGGPDQPAAAPRHRLEPHDPRQPASTTRPSTARSCPSG